MKNLLLYLSLGFALALGNSACQPEAPCDSVTCQNGGTCVGEGDCNCPPNYVGGFCQTFVPSSPCDTVQCTNGRTCVNGNCECPTGFGGPNCNTMLTPSSVVISKIELPIYPITQPNGSNWDDAAGGDWPDIFVTLTPGTSVSLNGGYRSNTFDNQMGAPLTFTTGMPIIINAPDQPYTLAVWDDDGSGNPPELMHKRTFKMTAYNGFFSDQVAILHLDAYGCVFHVDWNF